MSDPHVFVRMLAQMEAERARLAARVGHLDTAIGAVRNLLDLPPLEDAPVVATPAPPPTSVALKVSARKSGPVRQHILDALGKGPLSPANLATAVGMETAATMYHVKKLAVGGSVVVTGATNFNRRVALAPGSPKEAP